MNLLSKDPMYEAFGQRMMQMHYFALIQRIAAQVPLEAATGRDSRRMDVLRTAVSKLINTYISGTLFAVFRNPTFLIHRRSSFHWQRKPQGDRKTQFAHTTSLFICYEL
jgi:hypothetical protein